MKYKDFYQSFKLLVISEHAILFPNGTSSSETTNHISSSRVKHLTLFETGGVPHPPPYRKSALRPKNGLQMTPNFETFPISI